jgi:Helix-turn-helix domain/RodZ C-terminal domain
MGDVGAKLRDERERRGIGIDEIEAETRIRAKFLLALEEERFEALPGPAYVRAFVRDYAEQLGLDPQELVNDLNTRPELVEEVVMAPPRQADLPPLLGRRTRIAGWIVGVAIAFVILAAGLVVLGSTGGSHPRNTVPTTPATSAAAPATSAPAVPATTGSTGSQPPARPAGLDLAAAGGDVWLLVRAGTATGPVLYQSTLAAGGHLRFPHRRRLWVRVGAPWNLRVRAGGRPMPVPLQTIGNILVTAAGVRAAA